MTREGVRASNSPIRKAAKLAPDSYRAFSNLGGASTMACDFSGAADAYRKALALEPNDASTHYNLALALKYKGDARPATEEFEAALLLKPKPWKRPRSWWTCAATSKCCRNTWWRNAKRSRR